MRHDHLKKELDLILLLIQNRHYTTEAICQEIGISRRSLYYYLDFLRDAGFIVEKHGMYYFISRESPFFKEIFDLVMFTDEEAVLMRDLLDNSEIKTLRMKELSKKLERFYDFRILQDEKMRKNISRIMSTLHEAVKQKRTVCLVGYSSPHSKTVTDRIVEPFLFMNNNNDVRCHELASGKNKTFKLSRMTDVKMLDVSWENEEKHKKIYTDLFNFSGEDRMIVEMKLGQLSHNILLEEYPDALPSVALQEDGRWLFRTEVCSYLGIGRFVLGLYDDIEVTGDKAFIAYLRTKIKAWAKKQ